MFLIDHARAMARYNAWMNERLFETCAKLSDEERKRDVGAFFKSIHGTLNHILLADRIWMGRFEGRRSRSPRCATSCTPISRSSGERACARMSASAAGSMH